MPKWLTRALVGASFLAAVWSASPAAFGIEPDHICVDVNKQDDEGGRTFFHRVEVDWKNKEVCIIPIWVP
jgi:hypothetical protein